MHISSDSTPQFSGKASSPRVRSLMSTVASGLLSIIFNSSPRLHNSGGSLKGSGESQACVAASKSIDISPEVEEISESSAFKMGDGGSRTADSMRKSDEVRVSRVWIELKTILVTVR